MTEQAYSDYVAKCKARGIKPSSKEALCKVSDPEQTRISIRPPLHICSPSGPKHKKTTEKPMAKATIIPIEQIAKEHGITEQEARVFIKKLGAYPSNMTRQKVDELGELIRKRKAQAAEPAEEDLDDTNVVDTDVVTEEAHDRPASALQNRFDAMPDDAVIRLSKGQLTELYHRIRNEAFDEAEHKMKTDCMSTEELFVGLTNGAA